MYYAVLPASQSFQDDHGKHFNGYVQQNYKINDPNAADNGFCRRVSDDNAARASSMDMFQKQWRSSNIEPVQVNFANTPAQDAAIDAKLATGAQPQPVPVVNSKECAYHSTCAAAPAPAPAPTPAPAGSSASRPPWYTQCRYQGLKGGQQVVYITPIIHTDLAASDISTAFNRYMILIYNVGNITAGSGSCTTKMSSSADQQAYTTQQLEKQWADSKTPVTHLDWTGTPSEITAANAAQAATAAPPAGMAAPNAALREFYVFCYTDPSAPIIYFSEVFVGKADPSHQIGVSFRNIQNDFAVFLQQKYSLKIGPNCVGRTSASPQVPGSKQLMESQFKQANKQAQVAETGWKE
jgi:hypothetical protein